MAKAPPDLPTTHEDPGSRRTVLLGKGGAAQSRAHLTCVHTRVRLTLSAPHTCAPPLGPGPAAREGIWEPGTVSEAPLPAPAPAPPSPPFPGQEWSRACRGSQPAHIPRHPSLPPSAAAPVSAATSPEPVRRQRGEGEEARDELREGVGGPEPDEDAPGTGTRAGAGAGDRTKPPVPGGPGGQGGINRKRRDPEMQGGEGAARGLAQAGVEEVSTLTQACFLGSLSENFVPSCAAVSLEGTGARDEL